MGMATDECFHLAGGSIRATYQRQALTISIAREWMAHATGFIRVSESYTIAARQLTMITTSVSKDLKNAYDWDNETFV